MEEKKDCFILPDKPKEPLPEDCCGSECSYCVYDVYQMELKKWENECKRLLSGGKPSAEKQSISQLDFKTFVLTGIYPSAKSINIYRFAIPDFSRIDIKPGQHLMMKGCISENKEEKVNMTKKDNFSNLEQYSSNANDLIHTLKSNDSPEVELNYITRPYTVLNVEEDHFDILIKLYEDGQMSKYIRKLKVGEEVLWRGPFGEYSHNPCYSGNISRTLLAFCAGTGIVPIYRISKSIVSDENDETRIRILWANHSWDDMPLKIEMKELTFYWNLSCKLFFSKGINSVPSGAETFFEVSDGRVNFDDVKMELDSMVDIDIQVFLCGTKSFEEDITKYLNKLGVRNSSYHKFT